MMLFFIALSVVFFLLDFKSLKERGAKYIVPYIIMIFLSYVIFFFAEYTDITLSGLIFS